MLKNLSSLNYEMFFKIINNQPIGKEKIDFIMFENNTATIIKITVDIKHSIVVNIFLFIIRHLFQ